ncbi:MAG: recombinase family protein [Dehalococcoidales bacterium]|nr:recombinase family protein [Dehalococcoidales bacterium]
MVQVIGISAKVTDRPDLQRLIADVRAGHIRCALVTKLHHISRSLIDLLELMRLFEEQGAKNDGTRYMRAAGGYGIAP